MNYVKSAFNYTGSKYDLLDQLFKYFPDKKDVDLFVDVFCGGGSVFINSEYDKIISNDIIKPLINFYIEIQRSDSFSDLKNKLSPYILDKHDKEGYYNNRSLFNELGSTDPYRFFCLVQSCGNNMMRFNKSLKFNQTFGERTYNKNTELKLESYFNILKSKNVTFYNKNYTELLDSVIGMNNVFVYLDPPYFISEAGYNALWSKDLEIKMYDYLDLMDSNGIKFLMSNVSKHKGLDNPYMDRLSKYNIIKLDKNYEKVSKKSVGETIEIIVKNY